MANQRYIAIPYDDENETFRAWDQTRHEFVGKEQSTERLAQIEADHLNGRPVQRGPVGNPPMEVYQDFD